MTAPARMIDKKKPDRKKELKKLSRAELLEMLLELSRENDTLRCENEALRDQLSEKELRISESGSIAEAALKLNKVFEAAQEAADQYLLNVKRNHEAGEHDA